MGLYATIESYFAQFMPIFARTVLPAENHLNLVELSVSALLVGLEDSVTNVLIYAATLVVKIQVFVVLTLQLKDLFVSVSEIGEEHIAMKVSCCKLAKLFFNKSKYFSRR